jgi:hypothetical protein
MFGRRKDEKYPKLSRKEMRAAQADMRSNYEQTLTASPVIDILTAGNVTYTLHSDKIVKRVGSAIPDYLSITPATQALVEDTGAVHARTTLTRAATIGNGWQKEIDNRATLLTITDGRTVWVDEVTGVSAAAIRAFVARINLTSVAA